MTEAELKAKLKEAHSRCPPDPKLARIHFQASMVRQTENLDEDEEEAIDPESEAKINETTGDDKVVKFDDYFSWLPANSKRLPLDKDLTDPVFSELGVGFCE